jgi:PDZ domain-containing protein/aspartyl protease
MRIQVNVFGPTAWCCLVAAILALPVRAETSAEILALARAASGGNAWSRIRAIEIEGTISTGGLQGGWKRAEDLGKGRFAEYSDFGVYRDAVIFDGTTRWRVDKSGGVHPRDAAFTRKYTVTDSWLTRRAYLKPGAEGAEAGAPAERTDGGRNYAVISVTPAGGTPAELWFDSTTHYLARIVRQRPIDISIQSLADYRRVHGVMLPFQIVSGDEDTPNDETVKVTRYAVSSRGNTKFAKQLVRPAAPQDTELAGVTEVPFEGNGSVVVEASLDGQGPFAFILDTGGHNIVTPEIALQLGLAAVGEGRSGGAGEGTISTQDLRISRLKIGAAVLTDQHFFVIPLGYATVERGTRPPLAGILVLELFERLQARIDYRRRSLVLAPFTAPSLCRGKQIAIQFDDDQPLTAGRLDGIPGLIGIDTGNGGSTVIQGVWAAHEGLAPALKRGVAMVSFGTGGASYNWASRGHTINIGDEAVEQTEFRYAEDKKGAFSSRTEAANAGYFFLANFNVAFDYSRGQMCLERVPGFAMPPMNRSGLGLSKRDPAAFIVIQVGPESPAAAAGVQQGDKVVAVDGQSAAGLAYEDMFRIVRGAPGTHVLLQISRNGQVVNADVVLQEPRGLSLPP